VCVCVYIYMYSVLSIIYFADYPCTIVSYLCLMKRVGNNPI